MSEASTTIPTTETEVPAVAKTTETPAKAPEKPLNVDILNTATSRFTRKAWNEFLAVRNDLDAIRFKRYRIELESKTAAGRDELKTLLEQVDVTAIQTKSAKQLAFNASFEKLQTVMRHPETLMVDLLPVE